MFCFLQHFRILNAPSWLHDHVDPRLEALGKVDKYQFVPGARRDASQGPRWLCCQLSNHFPKEFNSLQYNLLVCNITHLKNIVLLLRFWARSHAVTSCQPWPASSARRWHQADRKLTQAASESPILESVKGWPAKVMVKILGEVALYSDILRITEVQKTTFWMLHSSNSERKHEDYSGRIPAVCLENFDNNVTDCCVRGDNVKFVRLLDVDGKISDGLIVVIKNNFGLLVAHCIQVWTKTQQQGLVMYNGLGSEQHVVEEVSYIDQLSVASYTTIRQST